MNALLTATALMALVWAAPAAAQDAKADRAKAVVYLEGTPRDKTIAWTKATTEDLRAHAAPHPAFGPLDAHQWILLVAGHSARHTAQIEEVKTAAGYPK